MNEQDQGVSAAPTAPLGLRPEPQEGLGHAASVTNAWPDELTPDLADILGRQCFMFIKLSQLYRAAGYDIPTSAEAEQAFFLHRFLAHWFRHGAGWLDAANADLRETRDRAAQAIEARQGGDPARGSVHESAVGNADAPKV